MAGNRPARERFEFSLDARQVAGVTLGSLGALALAFLLGHALGRKVPEPVAPAPRVQAPAPAPADALAALDQVPRPDGGEPAAPLSFHEALTSAKPPPDRLPPAPKGAAAPAPPTAPGPSGTSGPVARLPELVPGAPPPAAPATVAEPAPPPKGAPPAAKPAPGPAKAGTSAAKGPNAAPRPAPGKGTFTVQVGSTQDRFEAERIAARFSSRGARVVAGDVPGKGRWYRVRIGTFETREAADRYLRDLERSTGSKGFVAPSS